MFYTRFFLEEFVKFPVFLLLAFIALFGTVLSVSAQTDSVIGQITSSPAESFVGGISGDGRLVVFESTGNLATDNPRNSDGNREIFIFDYAQRRIFQITDTKSLLTNTTLSPTFDNIKVEISNLRPVISNDGRWIAFGSNATTSTPAVPNSTNPGNFDANTFTTTDGSNPLTTDANTEMWLFQIPAVAPANLSFGGELPVTDLSVGSFIRVTNTPPSRLPVPGSTTSGPIIADDNREVSINDNGNYIAFTSTRDLVPAVGNASPNANDEIFSYARNANTIGQITQTTRGTISLPIFNQNPSISGNGLRVAFLSNSNNPVVGMSGGSNSDGNIEIFYTDLDNLGTPSSNRTQVTTTTRANPGAIVNIFDLGRRMSRDGRYIAFDSFADLANDKAGAKLWLQAVQNITRPNPARGSNRVVMPTRMNANARMSGEELRVRKKPSVAQLMAQRVEEISSRAEKIGVGGDSTFEQANAIAECLALWDLQAALPVLRAQWKRGAKITTGLQKQNPAWRTWTQFLPRATMLRIQGGDGSAVAEYASWIAVVPVVTGWREAQLFEPLWLYPRDEKLANAAESLFNGTNSSWNPLVSRADIQLPQKGDLISSPLLVVPAFRRQIARLLKDTASLGMVAIDESGEASASVGVVQFGVGTTKNDGLASAAARKMSFRVCDFTAWKLARVAGAPRCELYWPQAARDKGVASASEFLRVFGVRLQPPDGGDSDVDGGVAHLAFPLLNRIASADDVARGAAVFTLTEPGQKRKAEIKLPQRALRKIGNFQQRGWIWQAEELLQNGQWRRFYGFVGPRAIIKVPAVEITLVP